MVYPTERGESLWRKKIRVSLVIWFSVKLLAKFTLVFIVVFGVGWRWPAMQSRQFLQQNAEEQVLQQARL